MKVGLRYLGGAIPSDDVEFFKGLMAENNIDFKTHDYEGEFRASFDEIIGTISIFIGGTNTITSFVQSIGASATWDIIKLMTVKIWSSARGKKYSKITSRRVEEKDITICVKADLKTDNYYFKIDGMRSSDEVNEAMDKVLTFLDQQKSKVDQHKIYSAIYDSDKKEWKAIDFLKKVMEKQKQGQ